MPPPLWRSARGQANFREISPRYKSAPGPQSSFAYLNSLSITVKPLRVGPSTRSVAPITAWRTVTPSFPLYRVAWRASHLPSFRAETSPAGRALTQSGSIRGRAFTLRLNQFRTKTRILLYVVGRQRPPNIGRFKTTIRPNGFTGGLPAIRKNRRGHFPICHFKTGIATLRRLPLLIAARLAFVTPRTSADSAS
jgi:hypothetical protein